MKVRYKLNIKFKHNRFGLRYIVTVRLSLVSKLAVDLGARDVTLSGAISMHLSLYPDWDNKKSEYLSIVFLLQSTPVGSLQTAHEVIVSPNRDRHTTTYKVIFYLILPTVAWQSVIIMTQIITVFMFSYFLLFLFWNNCSSNRMGQFVCILLLTQEDLFFE